MRAALQQGASPDADNGIERIVLRALFRKKWEAAEALLDAGATLKIPDRENCTSPNSCQSIHAALFASFNPPLLARLKARGLDLDAASAIGHTALTALIVEQPMGIRALNTNAEIPAPDNAARLRALLDAGADPNRKYKQLTPLMVLAGTHDRPIAMLQALVATGGRIEHDGKVPGHDAKVLSPGDGNYQGVLTDMRLGPLGWAVLAGRSDIAALVLERDRRIDTADRNIAYFAADAGSWDLLLTALRRGAPPSVANRAGVTPLMLAADAGRADVVRALIAAGADVRARSDSTWPPLLERKFREEFGAAIAGHSPAKPRLVGGYTAMRAAKERGHEEVVRVLREAGAD